MVESWFPKTIEEALKIRKQHPNALLMAGGTDVCVAKKQSDEVIFLNQIQEMKQVKKKNEALVIGAGAVYADLIVDALVPELLKKAMREVASPAIRSAGTLIGNICNASPAGDTLPVLYVMNATVVKARIGETQQVEEIRVPIQDFILGIRKIALNPGEIVTAVELPQNSCREITKQVFQKVGARQSEVISKLSMAGIIALEDDRVSEIRIAFGSVAMTVISRPELEEKIKGMTSAQLIENREKIVDWYGQYINPIDDQRSTAKYRKTVCLNLLRDFLTISE